MRPEFLWCMGLAYAISMDVLSARRRETPVSQIVADAQARALASLAVLLTHQREWMSEQVITRIVATLKADVGAAVRHACKHTLKVERQHERLTNDLSDALALALLALGVRAQPTPQPEPSSVPPRVSRLIELDA